MKTLVVNWVVPQKIFDCRHPDFAKNGTLLFQIKLRETKVVKNITTISLEDYPYGVVRIGLKRGLPPEVIGMFTNRLSVALDATIEYTSPAQIIFGGSSTVSLDEWLRA